MTNESGKGLIFICVCVLYQFVVIQPHLASEESSEPLTLVQCTSELPAYLQRPLELPAKDPF